MRNLGFAIIITVLTSVVPAQAEDTIPEIRVSLLNVAPGSAVYAAAGHAALRLECPPARLDYVFSYEMTLGLDQLAKFAMGKANGGYLAAPTADYLAQYTDEGRTVTEREINLTPRQKQDLWRWLDTEITKQMPYRYDYAHNMCSTMAIAAIEQALGDERIDWGTLPPQVTASSRTAMRFGMRHAPWARLFWDTILGTEGDRTPAPEENMCPELLLLSLQDAGFVSADGAARPFFSSPSRIIQNGRAKSETWFTPWLCFALVLAVALLLSLTPVSHRVQTAFDALLFTATGGISLSLFWMVTCSQLVATGWNWLVVPFCPLLPLLAITVRQHRRTVWLAECCLTAVCLPLAFAIPQFASPYLLIFAAMSVRALRLVLKLE